MFITQRHSGPQSGPHSAFCLLLCFDPAPWCFDNISNPQYNKATTHSAEKKKPTLEGEKNTGAMSGGRSINGVATVIYLALCVM